MPNEHDRSISKEYRSEFEGMPKDQIWNKDKIKKENYVLYPSNKIPVNL